MKAIYSTLAAATYLFSNAEAMKEVQPGVF